MISDISKHIELIQGSIEWAKTYDKNSFPTEKFKDYRRKLKKIRAALAENCSSAAYGESQVAKSYLMSSLLSSPESPFIIEADKGRYSFIDQINPSGGSNIEVESTGVITRFCVSENKSDQPSMVKIQNLSVVDLILLIVDSYYNDIRIDPETALKYDDINRELQELSLIWSGKQTEQTQINEDDIKDIYDYIKEVVGNNASAIYQSDFCKVVAPAIQSIPSNKWVDVFSLLWNKNAELSRLFSILIEEYRKLQFNTEVYVPFDAVLNQNGTLLKINWLDRVCSDINIDSSDVIYTDVYNSKGNILAQNFDKGYLSALIAEIIFYLPKQLADERNFLKTLDLLDFPGGRSREKFKEQEMTTVLPKMLRRGKVAYLFNKYSRSLRISSVLFCHHNKQKSGPTIGEDINSWIENNIGKTPGQRAEMLADTGGVSPLFWIATKFNLDLKRNDKLDQMNNPESLADHWKRFDTVFPEIVKPNTWLESWVPKNSSFKSSAFQSIYPLRDFYWSRDNRLFEGYSDTGVISPEKNVYIAPDYPNYMDDLKQSFIKNEFVCKHFEDPSTTWDNCATLNNDGTKAIINDLNRIAGVLEIARKNRYTTELRKLKDEVYDSLHVYFEPTDLESKIEKLKKISGDIRRSLYLQVGAQPESFGMIIDQLMIHPSDIREIAYDIIVRHSEEPKDFSDIVFLRKTIGINLSDSRDVNIQKLCHWGQCDIDKLAKDFEERGFTIEDVIANDTESLTSVADVVARNIIQFWRDYIYKQAKHIDGYIPHSEEVVFMLMNLLAKLNVEKKIAEKMHVYSDLFDEDTISNAIADYASLTFNMFVSNVGGDYITSEDLESIKIKADACGLEIDLTSDCYKVVRDPQSIEEALQELDNSSKIDKVNNDQLRKLPLWDSFQKWEKWLTMGLIYSSDVASCNQKANAELETLIQECTSLYQ